MRFHPFRPSGPRAQKNATDCPFCSGVAATGRPCNICRRAGMEGAR